MFASLGPVTLPAALKVFEQGDWKDRPQIAELLGTWRDADALEALRRAANQAPLQVQVAAANALAEYGGDAVAALPDLTRLAHSHWATEMRAAAAKAASRIGREPVTARQPDCSARQAPLPDGPEATSGIFLVGVPAYRPAEVERGGACPLLFTGAVDFALKLEDGCVRGKSFGEWGGWIAVSARGKEVARRATWYLNPTVAVPAYGSAFVFSEDLESGEAWRVDRAASGRWTIEPLGELPGRVLAYGFNSGGQLVILVDDRAKHAACGASPAPGARNVMLVIHANGTIDELR